MQAKREKQLVYSEGATFSGISFLLGLITISLAVYNLFHSPNLLSLTFWSLLLIPGIILLLAIQGVRFDFSKKEAHQYLDLLLIKIPYEKINLQPFKAVELRLFSENQTMNMTSISTTVRTRVYELYLKSGDSSQILIMESTDYAKALSLMKALSAGLNISAENKYEEWIQRVKNKRNHPVQNRKP